MARLCAKWRVRSSASATSSRCEIHAQLSIVGLEVAAVVPAAGACFRGLGRGRRARSSRRCGVSALPAPIRSARGRARQRRISHRRCAVPSVPRAKAPWRAPRPVPVVSPPEPCAERQVQPPLPSPARRCEPHASRPRSAWRTPRAAPSRTPSVRGASHAADRAPGVRSETTRAPALDFSAPGSADGATAQAVSLALSRAAHTRSAHCGVHISGTRGAERPLQRFASPRCADGVASGVSSKEMATSCAPDDSAAPPLSRHC
jgi:hypothetical protein